MAIRAKRSKQGDLDGACGFYSIVNAIHLLVPDIESADIFEIIFRRLIEDGNAHKFLDGTYRGTIKNTLRRVLNEINNIYTLSSEKGEIFEFDFDMPYWFKKKKEEREK